MKEPFTPWSATKKVEITNKTSGPTNRNEEQEKKHDLPAFCVMTSRVKTQAHLHAQSPNHHIRLYLGFSLLINLLLFLWIFVK